MRSISSSRSALVCIARLSAFVLHHHLDSHVIGVTSYSLFRAFAQGRVRVSFINEFGAEEAGMDQGGLFKEFLTDLAKAAFHPG